MKQYAGMRNTERQYGAHVSLQERLFIVKDDIESIWTQSKGIAETPRCETGACLQLKKTLVTFQEPLRRSLNADLCNPHSARRKTHCCRGSTAFCLLRYSHSCLLCFWCRKNLVCREVLGSKTANCFLHALSQITGITEVPS